MIRIRSDANSNEMGRFYFRAEVQIEVAVLFCSRELRSCLIEDVRYFWLELVASTKQLRLDLVDLLVAREFSGDVLPGTMPISGGTMSYVTT